jgi:hypothetical protein
MNILYTTEAVGGAGRAGHGRTSRGRLAALALFAFAASPAGAAAPFAQVDGSWSGADRIILTDGKSEGLKCRAYYTRTGGRSRDRCRPRRLSTFTYSCPRTSGGGALGAYHRGL